MPHLEMLHKTNPADDVWQAIGDLEDVEVFHNKVLVAIYKRPEKTTSGIVLPDSYRDEDKYQGKVGLIVKMGKAAFVNDAKWDFENLTVGDWIVFKPSDGWSLSINKTDCRMLEDTDVRGRIRHPDQVW